MTTHSIEISTDLESLVLGAFLNSDENTKIGLKLVNEDDFIEKKHKIILKAIQEVFKEKNVVDIALIHHKIASGGTLKEAGGGAPYLVELAQRAGSSLHVGAYCEDLKKLTIKRQLISLTNSLSTELQKGENEQKIISKLKEKIKNIEAHEVHAESAFRYLLKPGSEEAVAQELKDVSPGINVGYMIGDIDLKIPGGAISILAGPTSHGKTATLINFALGALEHRDQQDKSVYFFSYEESRAAITSLFLNTYINEPLSKNNRESIKSFFRQDDMQYITSQGDSRQRFREKKKEFFETLVHSGRLNIFYSDMTAHELYSSINFLKKNTNVGLVCIDYMQLLSFGIGKFGSRQEELKEVCLLLKDCAVETGLPILLGAQFNRQVTCEADLSPIYISEAGDIERVANLILGFWNRNFEGFTSEGNKSKRGQKIQKEPTIYMEILKGRETGSGQSEIFSFDGNKGKLSNKPRQLRDDVTKENVVPARVVPRKNS